MSEILPNGRDRATWLPEIEAIIADLEAELSSTEDGNRRLTLSTEIRDRKVQLDCRRRYLEENS